MITTKFKDKVID